VDLPDEQSRYENGNKPEHDWHCEAGAHRGARADPEVICPAFMSQGKLEFARSSFSGVHILLVLRMIASACTARGSGVVAGVVVETPIIYAAERSQHAAGREQGKSGSGQETCGCRAQ
jgi:hypothetical protein